MNRIKALKTWEEWEDSILREFFSVFGAAVCCEKLGQTRTLEAVRIRAARLGLKRDKLAIFELNIEEGFKVCHKCFKSYPLHCFSPSLKTSKDGLSHICKYCANLKSADSYRKHRSSKVERRRKDPLKFLLTNIKSRAKRKNIPFDLDLQDITIPEFCPVLGIKLEFSSIGKPTDASPSIDRIIPELGYVRTNVIVISNRANHLKSDAKIDELIKISEFYRKYL